MAVVRWLYVVISQPGNQRRLESSLGGTIVAVTSTCLWLRSGASTWVSVKKYHEVEFGKRRVGDQDGAAKPDRLPAAPHRRRASPPPRLPAVASPRRRVSPPARHPAAASLAAVCTPGGLPGRGEQWLKAFGGRIPGLLKRAAELDYRFVPASGPTRTRGHIPTTMEWARKLSDDDVKVLAGKAPYSEKVPVVDEGFTQADFKDPKRAQAAIKVIQARLAKAQQERPIGYLVREAPAYDVRNLQQLTGHVQAGLFITKFRKIFARDEMNDDLTIVPARYGDAMDDSEYRELLPVSPP